MRTKKSSNPKQQLEPGRAHALLRAALFCSYSVIGTLVAQEQEPGTANDIAAQQPVAANPGAVQFQPASAAGYPGMLPAAPLAGTSQLSAAPPPEVIPTGASGLVHWGTLNLHPHIDYQVSYGDSLQPVPGQHVNTLLNQVSPGILANLGTQWSLDYTPTLRFYSDRHFQDGLDHSVRLSGQAIYQDWVFGVNQAYASSSQPLVETGAQTDQQTYSTALSGVYTASSKISLDINVNQNFRFVGQGAVLQALADSREWSTMEWLNYHFNTRFSAGLGAGFTYDNVSVGPDMTSEQFQGRLNWTPTQKLSFALSGGFDERQFLSSGAPDLLSPVFSASIQYQLFEHTSLSLAATESIAPSYFQGDLTDARTISAGLRQRLLGVLFLNVSGGYTSTAYHSTGTQPGTANSNNLDVTSVNISLSATLRRHLNTSIFFQQTFVSSGSTTAVASLNNYTTTQGGLSLGYRF